MSVSKALKLLKEARKEIAKVRTTTDRGDYLVEQAKSYTDTAISATVNLAAYVRKD